jgi:hypothetical protein
MAPALELEMDYSIDLSARVGPQAADPALGDRLISALETAVLDAAVGHDSSGGTIGATFALDAPDVGTALEHARRLFAAVDPRGRG